MKYKIKEFYEKALVEGKFNSEFFKDLRKISTKVQLKNFIEEKILPIAKEMGYDFSVGELLNYEKEIAQKITEQALENVSGGVNLKNLAFGGIISLLTMGAGIIGTISSANAMDNGEIPQTSKDLLESDEEESQVDFSESREPILDRNTAMETNNDTLIRDFENALEKLLKELHDEFEQSIGDLYPRVQLILVKQFDEFYSREQDVVNQIFIDTPAERIIDFFKERMEQTKQNFDFKFRVKIRHIRAANMQINGIIRRIRETFNANIDSLKDPGSHNAVIRDFDSLMTDVKGDWLYNFNRIIANKNTYKEILEEVRIFEDLLYRRFRDEFWSKFKNPALKRSAENVATLKRSYTHAVFRGDTPQCPYVVQGGRRKINKKPKLAQLLERDAAMRNRLRGEVFTPFGKIGIKKAIPFNSRLIFTSKFLYGPRYTEIAKKLDDYCNRCGEEATLKMLYAILNYLETPVESGDTVENAVESLNCRVIEDPDLMPGASIEERECAAALCGILMLCESSQNRSENGGKRERAVIRTLIEIVYFGLSNNPFADAFGHVNPDGTITEGFYTPSAVTIYEDSSKDPSHFSKRKMRKKFGGTMRSRVLTGAVDKNKIYPPISSEESSKDEENTELFAFSSDSEKEYEERDVFTIGGRRYSPMDNPGLTGGCLWRIFLIHGVTDEHLRAAALRVGITYNDFVEMRYLELLLNEINRLGHYNLALHVDVFDYSGNYSAANSGYIPTGVSPVGANVICIALIYDSYDGLGHYVEKI